MNRVNYKCRHFVLLASLVFVNLCDACNTNGPFCIIQQWSPWSTCNATCGAGVIRREKYICCNLHLYNDLNGCLHGCNMTNDWWQKHSVQTKTCGYCTQHGSFNSTLQQCVCKRMFGGPCCNLKTTRSPTTTTTTTNRPTTTRLSTIPSTTTTKTTKGTTTTPSTTKGTTTTSTTKGTTTTPSTTKGTTTTPSTTKGTTTTHSTTKTRTTNTPPTSMTSTTTQKITTLPLTTTRYAALAFDCLHGNNICKQGKCAKTGNKFMCVCFPGFEGELCEIDKDDCASKPCVYGHCTDEVDNFHCDCMVLFTGKRCSRMKLWVMGTIGAAALLALLACCCCLWCILPACDRDNEEEDENVVKPNMNKIRPLPMTKPCYNDW